MRHRSVGRFAGRFQFLGGMAGLPQVRSRCGTDERLLLVGKRHSAIQGEDDDAFAGDCADVGVEAFDVVTCDIMDAGVEKLLGVLK